MKKNEREKMSLSFREEWDLICRLLQEIMTHDIPIVPLL